MRFEAGPPKKAERLTEKVTTARMRKPGVGFEVASDHVRGRIMVNDFSEAPKVLQALQDAGFRLKVGVNTQARPSGYKGMHAVLELEPGYNGEVQVHTEASWALKEASDKDYGIARVFDISDPRQQATKKALSEKTLKSYQAFWDAVPDSTKESISPWETGDISSHEEAGKGEGPGTQRPSTSSITPGSPLLPNRNTRPDSGQRTTLGNEETGERISEPPSTNIPQDEDKNVLPGLELIEDPETRMGFNHGSKPPKQPKPSLFWAVKTGPLLGY